MSEKKLYLIDGNSLLYRSYYAIQRLATSQGFPTNAIFGFISTLRKLMDQEKPEYLGIVFDAPGPKLRHDIYKDYKAQRKPMPEDLVKQIPKLKEVIAALRIPVIVHEKYEADDVLGSLARLAAAKHFQTVIVTTDKDLLQLVDGSTLVYNPAKEITLDAAKVKEVFGVAPAQVVDVLSLWGDPSDNVPGVPGIGEKTAKSLIEEFGSLENLLKSRDRIKNPRIKEKLEQNLDMLEMSRQLVTIEQAMDLEFDPEAVRGFRARREAEAARLFQELEFTSLLSEQPKSRHKTDRSLFGDLRAKAELSELAAKIKKAGAGLSGHRNGQHLPDPGPPRRDVVLHRAGEGLLSAPPARLPWARPNRCPVETAFGILRGVLEDPKVRKIGQNIKYDLIVLAREGIESAGHRPGHAWSCPTCVEPNWGKTQPRPAGPGLSPSPGDPVQRGRRQGQERE